MRKAKWLLIGIALLPLSAVHSFACTCTFIAPSRGDDKAQVVFTGKVIKSKKREWTIAVDKVWKGEVGKVITLRDAHSGTSCAASFLLGKSYLILADVGKSALRTVYIPQLCNWSIRLKSARLSVGEQGYFWAEEAVLENRGDGKPPTVPTH